MLIFTLSSIPPRFDKIGPTLQSLLSQTVRADKIILYIPETYRRFPDWDGTLPEVPEGVEIRRVPTDLGPATKILPALRDFAGQDCEILFGDDDRDYARNWAARFVAARAQHPDCALCTRGLIAYDVLEGNRHRDRQPQAETRRTGEDWGYQVRNFLNQLVRGKDAPDVIRKRFKTSGYIDIFEGCGAVMVRPEFFAEDVFDIPDLAWAVDDIWLSASLARNDVPIWLIANTYSPPNTDAQIQAPLAEETIGGHSRNAANQAVVHYARENFGIWV